MREIKPFNWRHPWAISYKGEVYGGTAHALTFRIPEEMATVAITEFELGEYPSSISLRPFMETYGARIERSLYAEFESQGGEMPGCTFT